MIPPHLDLGSSLPRLVLFIFKFSVYTWLHVLAWPQGHLLPVKILNSMVFHFIANSLGNVGKKKKKKNAETSSLPPCLGAVRKNHTLLYSVFSFKGFFTVHSCKHLHTSYFPDHPFPTLIFSNRYNCKFVILVTISPTGSLICLFQILSTLLGFTYLWILPSRPTFCCRRFWNSAAVTAWAGLRFGCFLRFYAAVFASPSLDKLSMRYELKVFLAISATLGFH